MVLLDSCYGILGGCLDVAMQLLLGRCFGWLLGCCHVVARVYWLVTR